MKNLIFLITFCLPAVCFGQVDGKGIICERGVREGLPPILVGFYFDSGTVIQERFRRERDIVSRAKIVYENYYTSATAISWSDAGIIDVYYDFSRKDGTLVETVGTFKYKYSCEVLQSYESYSDRMESIRLSKQEEYDKEREGNLL